METKQSPLDCARLGCGDPGSGTLAGTLTSTLAGTFTGTLASTAIKQKLNFGVESILGPQRGSAPPPRHDAPPPLARPRPRPSSPPPSPVSLVRAPPPPPPVKLSPATAPLLQLVAPPPPPAHSEGGSLALLGLGRAPESLPLVGAGPRLPGLASVASLSSPLLLPPHSVLGSPFLSPPLSPAPWYTGETLCSLTNTTATLILGKVVLS